LNRRRVDGREGEDLKAIQEVFFHITDTVLDSSFGMGRELHPIRTNRNSFSPSLTHFIPGAVDVLS
jgi:hypothetical protein